MPLIPALLLAALAATPVTADERVRLSVPRPIRGDITAMPRIARPADAAQRRINAALDRVDRQVRVDARECLSGTAARRGDWERTVEAPMRGPGFLSLVVNDDVDCGGAHPNVSTAAFTFDLASGAPVDWARLLPRALAGEVGSTEVGQGIRVTTLASPRLLALYRAGYNRDRSDADDKECRAVMAEQGGNSPVAMTAWLDAAHEGLALEFDLAHVVQVCAETIVIPAAVLRREGASPRLLDALAAAHRAWPATPSR